MTKRLFLNVEYSGIRAEIDVTHFEDLRVKFRMLSRRNYRTLSLTLTLPNYNSTTNKAR